MHCVTPQAFLHHPLAHIITIAKCDINEHVISQIANGLCTYTTFLSLTNDAEVTDSKSGLH